ncbi:MAG: RNA polymerase sigma factor [Planctomycetota bacterium]
MSEGLTLHYLKAGTRETPDLATTESLEESKYLQRLRQGDPEAFDRLVEQESPKLQRLVKRLLGWDGEVEDIVQEVLVDAWKQITRFRQDCTPSTWLYAIAIRKCRNVIRRRQVWRKCFQAICTLGLADQTRASTSERVAAAQAQSQDIQLALNRIPQKYREILVLVYLEEKNLADLAHALKLRKNTLEKRLSRARVALKQKLEETRERL